MAYLKSVLLSICIALILIGFFLKLTPTSKNQRAIKNVLSLIIILVIASPIASNISYDDVKGKEKATTSAVDYSGLIEGTTVNLLKSRIENAIEQKGINFKYVDIMVTEKNNMTRISAITVYVESKEDIPKVKAAVRQALQLDVGVAVAK